MSTDAPSLDAAESEAVFDPSIPLHHQVYLLLRGEVADGLWEGRDDFPGERELAARLGVSVITSRAALDRLAGEGWIQRRRGRRPQVLHRPDGSAAEPAPSLMPVGRQPLYEYTVLLARTRGAPAGACAAFGFPSGHDLWQCVRLRSHDGAPHSVAHNAQLPELGEAHDLDELAKRSMAELLAAQGKSISRMRRHMSVAHPPALIAEALGLTVAERVLVTTFTLYDGDGRVLEWVRIYLHPKVSTPEETMDLTAGAWWATERM